VMTSWVRVCATVVASCGCALACGSEGEEFTPGKQDAGSGGSSGASTGGSAGSAGTAGVAGSSTPDAGGAAGADAAPDVAVCDDVDGDGSTTCDGDCDDNDATSYPGATEICGDAADNDCANGADDTCAGIGTFVSELTGDDANPGTQTQPVKTIGKGIANAQTIQASTPGPLDVYVGEGSYPEKVALIESVNLVGGFSCNAQPCSWTRDPAVYITTIENQDAEGVLADSSITRQTRLDGFNVHGQSSAPTSIGVVGVTLAGGTPTVVNNTITAGDSSAPGGQAGRSIGLLLYGPSNDVKGARIEANDIRGGGAPTDTSAGIFFDAGGKPGFNYAEIVSNSISGGTGKNAQAVTAWSSGTGTLIQNNDIQAGDAGGAAWGIAIGGKALIDSNRINADTTKPAKCQQFAFCGGIRSDSSTIVVTNNVVFGVQGQQSAAVLLGEFEIPAGSVTLNANYLDGAGSPNGYVSTALALQHGQCCGQVAIVGRVANNVLAGGKAAARYGVYEIKVSGKAAHPELLMNNDFFVPNLTASDGYYQYVDTASVITKAVTLAEVTALALPLVSGNIEGDPLLDSTYHLPTGSPAINAGTLVDLPAKDFEGEARPKGIAGDIGPDEAE
jgi:hypothetical protein